MGGIVSITITKKEDNDLEDKSYYYRKVSEKEKEHSTRIKQGIDTKSLSFPLQNKLGNNEPIQEEIEDDKEPSVSTKSLKKLQSEYQFDEKIKNMEKELMRDYEKWNIENRKNHESAMVLFGQYNSHSSHI